MTDRADNYRHPEDEYYPDTSALIKLEGIRDPIAPLECETELQIAADEVVFISERHLRLNTLHQGRADGLQSGLPGREDQGLQVP